jgi:GT2 family glycosyltransferase
MIFKKNIGRNNTVENFVEIPKTNPYNFNNPKVSAIISVYNAEKYLMKCLDSVINQTLEDIEIICIDDGSTDDSLKILEEYAFIDNRIKVISKINEGPGAANKTGIDNAFGNYIFFIDCDDWIVEDALERLYLNTISNDSDIVFLDFLFYNEDEKKFNSTDSDHIIANQFNKNDEIDFKNFSFTIDKIKPFLLNRFFTPWNKIYKHSFLKKYDDFYLPKNIVFYDVFFHVQILLRANKISYCPYKLYIYRISNSSSITNTSDKSMKIFQLFDVITNVEKFLIKNNKMNEYNIEFKLFVMTHLNLHFERVSEDISLQLFKKIKEKFIQLNLSQSELKELPNEYNTIYEKFVGSVKKYDLFNYNEVDDNLVDDIKKNKIVIYTAIAGNYDSLKDPDFIDENCDYVCFSDNPDLKSDIWKIISMDKSRLDNNRKAKQYRVLPHKFFPEYKYSFWIDASFRIKNSIRKYIYTNINSPMLVVMHDERDCIYDETTVCTDYLNYPKTIKYPQAILLKQIKKYEFEGMPKNYGLIATGFLFREHNNPKIIKLMEDWWNEINIFTTQCQISLSYVAWKNDFHPSVSMIYVGVNEYWENEYLIIDNQLQDHSCENSLTTYNLINEFKNVKDEIILSKEEINLIVNDITNYEFIHREYLQMMSLISDKNKLIEHYSNSLPWKITKPLRLGRKLIRKLIPFFYILKKSNIHFIESFRNFKVYNILKKSDLFDEEYYLNKYPSLKKTKMPSIIHYLYYGYLENKNPSEIFNGVFYSDNYDSVRESKINPLVHYILYGQNEGNRINQDNSFWALLKMSSYNNNYSQEVNNTLNALGKKISIIIPIYNAYEDTKKCIESVLKYTTIPFELILIDDKSTDNRINTLLNKMEKLNNVKVIRNLENKGFVKNVNIGINNSKEDVLLLNSDTIVTPRWIQKLIFSVYSKEDIGTATPISNSAGVFPVPDMRVKNKIPEHLTLEEMSSLVEKVSADENMEIPTGNGFCMLIKRKLINEIGLFDEDNFGKGYGEENDFCMRAIKAGWKNVLDSSTYIYHEESASFNEKKEELIEKHLKIIHEMYPSYAKKITNFISSKNLKNIQDNIKITIDNLDFKKISDFNKKRILYILHQNTTEVHYHTTDLIKNLKNFESYMLTSNAHTLILYKFYENRFIEIYKWDLKSKWTIEKFRNNEFRNIYFNIILSLKIDIIHIHHLINHTFDLPYVANKLGIPIILSFYDFYYICPSINLLDENNEYCGGICSNNRKCLKSIIFGDSYEFIKIWRKEVLKMFNSCSIFIIPSKTMKKIYLSNFSDLKNKNFKIIGHGQDFNYDRNISHDLPYKDGKKIKILFTCNIDVFKGVNFIKNLKKIDKMNKLEFHFVGNINKELKNYGIHHGYYENEELYDVVNSISPSFIGIFPVFQKTYCYTLFETYYYGIPILTTEFGALGEIIKLNGGGVILDYENYLKSYEKILKLSNSIEEYNKLEKELENIYLKSEKHIKFEFEYIYKSFFNLF